MHGNPEWGPRRPWVMNLPSRPEGSEEKVESEGPGMWPTRQRRQRLIGVNQPIHLTGRTVKVIANCPALPIKFPKPERRPGRRDAGLIPAGPTAGIKPAARRGRGPFLRGT
jgi:hypothetical protein